MRKPWDSKLKQLFNEVPHDLVAWLLADAVYVGTVSPELDSDPIFADMLYELRMKGKPVLLHLEFQRRRDANMAERLWKYNVLATIKYQCPVWSCVIYLKKDGTAPEPVLVQAMPNDRAIHRFDFEVICLWDIPTQTLKELGLVGLLPLLPLTREGNRREVVEEVLTGLMPPGEEPRSDLLALTYGLASLAFEQQETDQQWLLGRFAMIEDILRETQAYKEMTKGTLQEGLEKGLQEGLEKGLQEGLEKERQAFRQTLINIVQVRFPKLVRLTKKMSTTIDDTEVLQGLILNISTARTIEEAKQHLLDIDEDDEEI